MVSYNERAYKERERERQVLNKETIEQCERAWQAPESTSVRVRETDWLLLQTQQQGKQTGAARYDAMRSKAKGKRQKSSEWSGRRSTLKRWQWTSYVVFCCLLVFLVCVRCCYCYCCCRSTVCSTVCYGSRATHQELAAATKTVRINCATN